MWRFGLVLALAISAQSAVEEEDGVLVLTTDNFDEAVKANPLMLVEFYAPWCGHCKKLAPEYAKAAASLAKAKSEVKLAKVDVTENKELGTKFGIGGYPTLKFFKSGKPQAYDGGRTEDTIVAWLNKKTGPPAPVLGTEQAAAKLVEDNQVVILGFFASESSEAAKEFVKAATSMGDKEFGMITDKSLFGKYEATEDMVVLLKKFDEGRNVLGGKLSEEVIVEFVKTKSVPLVITFSQESSKTIFGSVIRTHFMLCSSAKESNHKQLIETVTKLAKEHKGEMSFVYIPMDEPNSKRMAEFLGVTEAPAIRIINLGPDTAKYKPNVSDLTEEAMRAFIAAYKAGRVEKYLKTEDVPADWDAKPVKVLVGKNFEKVALDSTKDVLVEFYAPWCGHCKKLEPVYDQLAEHFKDVDDVVIAKMDATLNEISHKDAKVAGFPTIFMFNKDGSVKKYEGDRTLDSFKDFVRPSKVDEADEASEEEDYDDDYEDDDYEDSEEDSKENVKDEL